MTMQHNPRKKTSFFPLTFPPLLLPLTRGDNGKNAIFYFSKNAVVRDVVSTLVDLYINKSSLENLQLESVLFSYSLGDLVEVRVGLMGNELYYVVNEPKLEKADLDTIVEMVINDIMKSTWRSNLGPGEKVDKTSYNYMKITSGWGPLTPCILDPHVEDVFLSKKTSRVYVVHNKLSWIGWIKSNIVLDPELVDRLIVSLSRRVGKHISLASPIAEGSYGDKFRVSLIYGEEVSPHGSSVVVRKRSNVVWTITRLINEGSISSILASYLWMILENRGWIIIAGHVGSGKTTLLQALLSLIPPYKKLITIEDTPEIAGTTGLWEPLVEKSEVFTRGSQIDSFTLLKFALRRRPDYIVIGEVRGVEARLLVQASRLGHGIMNTIHADSAESVIKRLTAPPISIPRNLLNNIWAIVVMGIQGNKRKVVAVSEVNEDSSLVNVCSHVECWRLTTEDVVSSSIRLRRIYAREELFRELVRRALFLEEMVSKGVFSLEALTTKLLEFHGEAQSRPLRPVENPAQGH